MLELNIGDGTHTYIYMNGTVVTTLGSSDCYNQKKYLLW